jgi:hypothetical protein
MTAESELQQRLKAALGRAQCVLCGRGTTALWLALGAIRGRDGPGEVILPDILCQVALEGVLLAGFTPVFAAVLPGRLTLAADRLAPLVTPHTRAILVAHLFGHVADLDAIRQAAPGIPLIEDAVQGIGGTYRGKPVGAWGDLAFVSFDKTKMIGGRGGALLFDDDSFLENIESNLCKLTNNTLPLNENLNDVNGFFEQKFAGQNELLFETIKNILCKLPNQPLPKGVRVPPLFSNSAASVYASRLKAWAPQLLCRFDSSLPNVSRILTDWETLNERNAARVSKAHLLRRRLAIYPLLQPEIRVGDVIWRYTITFPSSAWARWIVFLLQSAGISGSTLYYPLSGLFGFQAGAENLTNRLINLFVDETTDEATVHRAADVIGSAPWSRFSPR